MLRAAPKQRRESGETLLVTLVAVGLFSLLVLGAVRTCSNQFQSTALVEQKGIAVDVANNLRRRFSCTETLKANAGKCCTASPVVGKDASGRVLFASNGDTPYTDKIKVHATCNVVQEMFEFSLRYQTSAMTAAGDLLAAPIVCDSPARWVQSQGMSCAAACAKFGGDSLLSPDGNYCASGEMRPASAAGQISYTHGCWGGSGCRPNNYGPWYSGKWFGYATTHGQYCFRPGDKMDYDQTDVQVGCYCGIKAQCNQARVIDP